MPDVNRTVLWTDSGDGECLHAAFRRLADRDLDLSRPLFEEMAGGWSRYRFRGGFEVLVPAEGPCSISRVLES